MKIWPAETQLLTLSWRRSLSYRNQSIDLQSKSVDWFLYDRDLSHERVNKHPFDPWTLSEQHVYVQFKLWFGATFETCSHQRCSVKKVFLVISLNSPQACNFIKKETLTKVFFCEFSRRPFYRTTLDDCFWKILTNLKNYTTKKFLINDWGGVSFRQDSFWQHIQQN